MRQAGLVSRGQMLRAAYGQLIFQLLGADERRMEKAKRAILEISRGWDRAQVEELVRDAVVEVIDPFVYQEALDLMAEHRREGRKVYIVSSAPEEVVYPIARHFSADGVVATRAEIVDGLYTGKLAFYCFGQAKADAMRSFAKKVGLDLSKSYAYSDSATDIPMLEAVGNPAAVNPSRELRKEAEAREWDILDFDRPVPMMPRPPAKTAPAAAIAGAVAAACVAVWLFARSRRRVA